MASPRAVRIPRSAPPRPVRVVAETGGSVERRPNVGGSQRAVRLTLSYLIALAVLYLVLVEYGRSAPGGTSPGAQDTLLLFGGIAVALGAVGAGFSLTPAPRAVEVSPYHVVVVGRWGRRTKWPPLGETTVRVVRSYRAGPLSSTPVESVEMWATGRRPKVYLLEQGLLAPTQPRT